MEPTRDENLPEENGKIIIGNDDAPAGIKFRHSGTTSSYIRVALGMIPPENHEKFHSLLDQLESGASN